PRRSPTTKAMAAARKATAATSTATWSPERPRDGALASVATEAGWSLAERSWSDITGPSWQPHRPEPPRRGACVRGGPVVGAHPGDPPAREQSHPGLAPAHDPEGRGSARLRAPPSAQMMTPIRAKH